MLLCGKMTENFARFRNMWHYNVTENILEKLHVIGQQHITEEIFKGFRSTIYYYQSNFNPVYISPLIGGGWIHFTISVTLPTSLHVYQSASSLSQSFSGFLQLVPSISSLVGPV